MQYLSTLPFRDNPHSELAHTVVNPGKYPSVRNLDLYWLPELPKLKAWLGALPSGTPAWSDFVRVAATTARFQSRHASGQFATPVLSFGARQQYPAQSGASGDLVFQTFDHLAPGLRIGQCVGPCGLTSMPATTVNHCRNFSDETSPLHIASDPIRRSFRSTTSLWWAKGLEWIHAKRGRQDRR